MPRPSPSSVGVEALRAAETAAPADVNVEVGSHGDPRSPLQLPDV